MSERSVLVEGQSWNVFEAGSGPPLVFLHNGGGTLWNWAYQLEHFSHYRVIAPDLPGFGRSHRPSEALSLEKYVGGLEVLLERLDCPKPYLVGNCIGASVALEYSLRHPEKVAALALFNVCGGPPMLNPALHFWASLRPQTKLGKALHQYLVDAAGHPVVQGLGGSLLYANGEPQLHSKLAQFAQQQRLEPKLRASLYWLVIGLDSFSRFSRPCQKPANFPKVLLGWGAQNRTLDVRWVQKIAQWLEPDQLWLIENAGHLPMYEQPQQVNERLEGFFG